MIPGSIDLSGGGKKLCNKRHLKGTLESLDGSSMHAWSSLDSIATTVNHAEKIVDRKRYRKQNRR